MRRIPVIFHFIRSSQVKSAILAKLNDAGELDDFRPLVNIAKVFAQVDADGSGKLSIDELKAAFKSLELSDEDADTLLANLDTNGDAEIDLDEWRKGLDTKMYQILHKHLDGSGLIAGLGTDHMEKKK